MRSLRSQFFLTYALLGCLVPYIPVYLESLGMPKRQIGQVLAISSIATILSPALVTLLADARLSGRILMAGLFAIAGGSLALLMPLRAFMPIAALYLLHALAIRPALPLQDGLNFALQQRRKAEGLPETPYHRIRIFGSVGYMLPSFLLYILLLHWPQKVWIALAAGVATALLGLANALRLPAEAPRAPVRGTVPTFEAGQRMLRPPLLVFCLALLLFNISAGGFYAFYPTYLTGRLSVPVQWIGMISNLGVCAEVALVLSFGFLVQRFGLKAILLTGTLSFALRMALLAAVPSIVVAVGTQLLHGLMVIAIIVAPPMFLNRHAEDRFRNSIQGLYTMTIAGTGQVLGYLIAGQIATGGEQRAFWFSAITSLAAALLIALQFREHHAPAAPA